MGGPFGEYAGLPKAPSILESRPKKLQVRGSAAHTPSSLTT